MFLKRFNSARIFLFLNLAFIAVIFIIGFLPGAYQPHFKVGGLAAHQGKNISFSGRVCAETELSYKNRRLTICADEKVLVTTDLYPEYDYGDFLRLSGYLEPPPTITGFDYGAYLARYNIYSLMYYPKIEKIEGRLSVSQRAYGWLLKVKGKLRSSLNANLPEPEAGLANALLLGYRRSISQEDLQLFSRVGLSHMIAISGSHLTIMSAMIIDFFLNLGFRRRRVFGFILAFLFLYPLMTGLSASAVRSAIMGALGFIAVYYKRRNSLIYALIFSAALMLVFNPKLLRADLGFQLSFASLLGLIYLAPFGEEHWGKFLKTRRLFSRFRRPLKVIGSTINLTLVSQIMILPIVLVNFQQFSIIAPLANVLVLWVFAPLLAWLLIGLGLAALIPPLSLIGFFPAYLMLKFIFITSRVLAAPTWAAVGIGGFNWYLGALYYLVLAFFISFKNRRRSGA